MRNRMIVLSNRLRSFAFCFSFATFASALFGLIANSGMIVISNITGRAATFFFAGLGLLCFFAALLLWLAYGFAWAMVPEKPAEEKRYVQSVISEKAAEEYKPIQELKPVQEYKPVQENVRDWKPAEETSQISERPVEAYHPQEYKPIQIEEYKPIQEYKPPQEYKPIQYEAKKSVEEKAVAPEKPAAEKKRAKWWKKPEEEKVEYTITGRRIE